MSGGMKVEIFLFILVIWCIKVVVIGWMVGEVGRKMVWILGVMVLFIFVSCIL